MTPQSDDLKRLAEARGDGMSKQETLEQAIQKAIDGGWRWHYRPDEKIPKASWIAGYNLIGKNGGYNIIFDHDFAKALWGEEWHIVVVEEPETFSDHTEYGDQKEWQYRLQQMVIADDPIKYLGENL